MTLKVMTVISILAGSWGSHCLDTTRLPEVGGFDSQLNYILDAVRITSEEMNTITHVYKDVAKFMKQLWPDSEIKPFGATASGLGMKSSDVDFFVDIPNTSLTVEQCAEMAKSYLETHHQEFTNVQTVPIPTETFVQCQHVPTKHHVDLTFTKPGCIRDTALIRYFLNLDKRASDLAMIVKYWAKEHHLIGLYWMPSFSITMQVLFFLQQKGIAPSVIALQNNSKSIFVNNWETGFDNDFDYKSDNNETLYQLLGGFFKYYSTFDYDTYIISPFVGRPVRRDLFNNLDDVPDEFALYKHNGRLKIKKSLKLNASMVIQDPFEHNNNSGEFVCSETVERIITHFKYAAKMFEQSTNKDFLASILGNDVPLDSLVGQETGCWVKVIQS